MSSLNSVRHIVILLLIGFVAYISFSNEVSLFSFHPPLMLIGVSITKIPSIDLPSTCFILLVPPVDD